MDEVSWLLSEDPQAMLDFLHGGNTLRRECPMPLPSDRKLRLFACACARRSWGLMNDRRSRAAVALAECFADGRGTEEERVLAERRADEAFFESRDDGTEGARYDAWACCHAQAGEGAMRITLAPVPLPYPVQAAMLRDVVGNPFRPLRLPACPHCEGTGHVEATRFDGSDSGPCGECGATGSPWLTPDALRVARAIYADRDFGSLPVLADALEEAGCESEDLLMHLRGKDRCPACLGSRFVAEKVHVPDPPYMHRMIPHFEERQTVCLRCGLTGWVDAGPHALGCVALDAVLGKG